jgi:hypothetical protein
MFVNAAQIVRAPTKRGFRMIGDLGRPNRADPVVYGVRNVDRFRAELATTTGHINASLTG